MNRTAHYWISTALIGAFAGMPFCHATSTANVGEPFALAASEGGRKELVYYVWDTGDGRLVPTARGFAEAVAPVDLTWWKPGSYQTAWRAVGGSGWASATKLGPVVEVTGTATVQGTLPLHSATASTSTGSFEIPFGKQGSLEWKGVREKEDFLPSSLMIPLASKKTDASPRRVDWLVLTAPRDDGGKTATPAFPRHFLIQSGLSPEGPWYPVLSADFAFFPDPKGREVWIPLHGLMVGALRIVVSRGNPLDGGSFGWSLGSVRVLGGGESKFGLGEAKASDLVAWNNLWLDFGIAANEVHQQFDPWWETNRPIDGGMVCIGSCEWLGVGALKLSWLADPVNNRRLESYIAGNPVGADGYAWAAPGSEKHLGHSRHDTLNAIYTTAVAHHYLMRRDPAFLEKKDPASGESVLSKARRAMDYQLDVLGGRDGVLTIPGVDNDGTPSSKGSNYWDFWLFGYKDAYATALFYESLRLMAELESSLGNEARAEELRALRPKVRAAFNETFWDDKTGRYVGWVDAKGNRYDYGFTFVNTMALAYGLADAERSERVLSWLDGGRTVAGDDSTGKDIYAFGFAPRSNTVDARHGTPPPINTWNNAFDVRPGGNAEYGQQVQNGGSIFYVSYYDLHARRQGRGAEDVLRRWQGIASEFGKDQLRRDPSNNQGNSDIFGILREFPESGLVPYYFIDGLLGLSPVAQGLRIAPQLPKLWPSATVCDFYFAGKTYTITADSKAKEPIAKGALVTVPTDGIWLLTPDGKIQRMKDADNAPKGDKKP